MCGIQSDFLSPFPHSGCMQFLEGGQGSTNNPFTFTFTFSHFADAFIQSDLQLGST